MKKEEKKKTVMEAMAEQSNQELGTKDNLQYKNDFFVLLMNEKKYALEVYNALNGSDYKNPDDIQIITLQYGFTMMHLLYWTGRRIIMSIRLPIIRICHYVHFSFLRKI